MFTNVLLPTDGSQICEKAIATGVYLAKALDARVTAVYVAPRLSLSEILGGYELDILGPQEAETAKKAMDDVEELQESAGRKYLGWIEGVAKEAGVSCTTVYVKREAPAAGILKVAGEKECDLIFMSAHGRSGITSALLGSVTQKVLALAKLPVFVFRCEFAQEADLRGESRGAS